MGWHASRGVNATTELSGPARRVPEHDGFPNQ